VIQNRQQRVVGGPFNQYFVTRWTRALTPRSLPSMYPGCRRRIPRHARLCGNRSISGDNRKARSHRSRDRNVHRQFSQRVSKTPLAARLKRAFEWSLAQADSANCVGCERSCLKPPRLQRLMRNNNLRVSRSTVPATQNHTRIPPRRTTHSSSEDSVDYGTTTKYPTTSPCYGCRMTIARLGSSRRARPAANKMVAVSRKNRKSIHE